MCLNVTSIFIKKPKKLYLRPDIAGEFCYKWKRGPGMFVIVLEILTVFTEDHSPWKQRIQITSAVLWPPTTSTSFDTGTIISRFVIKHGANSSFSVTTMASLSHISFCCCCSSTSWDGGTSFTYHELVLRWLAASWWLSLHESSRDEPPMMAALHFFKYERTLDLVRRTSTPFNIDSLSAVFECIEKISSNSTDEIVEYLFDESLSAGCHGSVNCGSGLALVRFTLSAEKKEQNYLWVRKKMHKKPI